MAIEPITAEQTLDLDRGSVVVCVALPERASDEAVTATLAAICAHTAVAVPVVLACPAQLLSVLVAQLAPVASGRALRSLAASHGANGAGVLDAAIAACAPADLALVMPGVCVAAGWLEGLSAAAREDSTIASATPLSLGPAGVRLDEPGSALGAGELSGLARRLSEHTSGGNPRLVAIGPGCAYLRRPALELLGELDEPGAVGNGLQRLARRATAAGMVHVLAGTVLISSVPGGEDPPPEPGGGAPANDPQAAILAEPSGAVRQSLAGARRALRRLSVRIDARALVDTAGGTQTYMVELIVALAAERELALSVITPPDLSPRAARALGAEADTELLAYELVAAGGVAPADVVHRPQQAFTPDDLRLLGIAGERIVIGHQDLIAFHNHSYHPDIATWLAFREATRLSLSVADRVVFFSEHACRDAIAERLLAAERGSVVAIGLGSDHVQPAVAPHKPGALSADGPFLLCLGADYEHKNRCFAIELLEALHALGWQGSLLLAGGHVPYGSSREREQRLLAAKPGLASRVIELGPVEEAEKQWLYEHATALVYPTLYEGFGLLPIEAARAGLPCLFAPQASLAEIAGDAATLIPWDAAASARVCLALLTPGAERDAHLQRLREIRLPSWGEVAQQLLGVYEQSLRTAPTSAAERIAQAQRIGSLELETAHLRGLAQEYQDGYHALEQRVGGGLPLIDATGGLLNHSQQVGLMRVASRGWPAALALAPFGLIGRRHEPGADALSDS